MTTNLTAEQIVWVGRQVELLLGMADDAGNVIEVALAPVVKAWADVEPVPCGHTGGWSFKRIEGTEVRLEHECFYAHGYDLHDSYSTNVPLTRLLAVKG